MIERPVSQERVAQIAFGIIGEHVDLGPTYQAQTLKRAGLCVPVESLSYWRGHHGGSCMIALAQLHDRHPWVFAALMSITICSQLLWNAVWLW